MTETQIFGIAADTLQPFVENAVGEAVDSFRISFEYQLGPVKGFNAEKVIPTFYWKGRSGREGRTIMFVKRNPIDHDEVTHYAQFAKHGAPIPRLYGTLRDDQGRNILFLEYLDAVYDADWFFAESERCRRYFSAMAHFHAIRPDPDYVAKLEQKPADRRLAEALELLDATWQASTKGELGEELEALCRENAAALPRVVAAVRASGSRVAGMPLGLNCCGPMHQSGWRRETGEIIFADLDRVCIGPRFWDIADELAGSEAPADFALPREELGRCYLEGLAHHGGEPAPLDVFLSEVRDIGILTNAHVLGFWLRGPRSPRPERLHATLSLLLAEAAGYA